MWNPPPTVTEHNGEPLSADCDFFIAPPTEIGVVRSAHTSLTKTGHAKPKAVRVAIAAAWGIVGFLLIMGFQQLTKLLLIPADLTGTPPWLWAAGLSVFPVYWGWRYSRFTSECSFVGDAGCAQFRCEGDRANVVKKSVLLFQAASAVATRFTRHTKNTVYQDTKFYFHWYSKDPEKQDFEIAGEHYSDAKTPPKDNIYHFGRAAESAWYDFVTPRIDAAYANQGSAKFYMGSKRWAVLGNGFIQIVDPDGKTARCEADDIASAKLRDGYFTIRRKDAKTSFFHLFDKEGVFGFNYATIHNARLFLYLFEKSLGIRVQ